jgi:hypothetical protein
MSLEGEGGQGLKNIVRPLKNKKHNYTLNKNTQRFKKNAQKNKNFVVKYFVTHKINLC